jgi:7-carboxy-7-deazaguanine synthase
MEINEIFQSISGEVGIIPQGAIAWFIRFQGCNLRCAWCDTRRAQSTESEDAIVMTPKRISEKIPFGSNVVLTGGEPLLQNQGELWELISLLSDKECIIQVETNGSQKPFLPICHVFDYKTPSSGEQNKMMEYSYFLKCLSFSQTWIKFVIKNQEDLEYSIKILKAFQNIRPDWKGLYIALSVSSGKDVAYITQRIVLELPELISHIIFNFQLHKHFDLK